jgi:hypothetical protein
MKRSSSSIGAATARVARARASPGCTKHPELGLQPLAWLVHPPVCFAARPLELTRQVFADLARAALDLTPVARAESAAVRRIAAPGRAVLPRPDASRWEQRIHRTTRVRCTNGRERDHGAWRRRIPSDKATLL